METTETAATAAQYLTFRIGEETFAVDVVQVQEVLELLPITRIPKAPGFMRGVVNVRGRVVPVVDLRRKFELEDAEFTVDTCIVVLEISLDAETVVLGALVDSVQEVIELQAEQIEPAPRMGTTLDTEFIRGIGTKDELFIIILDTNKILSSDELDMVQETGSAETAATD
jgi:purine-binding chemotaxis protein CheW